MSDTSNQSVINEIEELIKTFRVYLNAEGGDLEFVSYENRLLTLKLTGHCVTCSMNFGTMDGIKAIIKQEIKDVQDVKFVL